MKNFSYTFVLNANNFIIISIKNICLFLVSVFAFCFNKLLYFIDKDRLQHGETVNEQSEELSELNILISIKEVRDHAIKIGGWNAEHEQQLNMLGNVLANTFDWEVDQVEDYLIKVIETGPIVD